jgi:hypothetical protein
MLTRIWSSEPDGKTIGRTCQEAGATQACTMERTIMSLKEIRSMTERATLKRVKLEVQFWTHGG